MFMGRAYDTQDSSHYAKGPVGPPQPLGSEARCFPVSAATPLPLTAESHPSGISVRLKLDTSGHPDRPFRTGELVQGHVHIYAPSPNAVSKASRLSLRIYFESRTLFWSLELAVPKSKAGQQIEKMKGTASKNLERVMRHEVHRGIVPSSAITSHWSPGSPLVLNFQICDPSFDKMLEATLPFSFLVPRKMNVTEYNRVEGAPRGLCSLARCPPPTLRDCRDASVQWVAEAILTLEPGSTPVQDESMLRQSTDKEIVTRLVFPVLPAPEDVGVLRDEPYFGDHPMTRLYGSRMLSQEDAGKKANLNRALARGESWDIYTRKIGCGDNQFVDSHIYATRGARISNTAQSIQLLAYLNVGVTNSKPISSFFRSPKPQSIYLQRAVVSLYRMVSTRGGKETKPHISEYLLRQKEHGFESSASSSTSTGLLLPSGENEDAIELDLTIDLQSETEIEVSGNKQMTIGAKHFTPSFRTPNIQHEYLLTVSYWFFGDEIEGKAARFPIQFTPGDDDQPPVFEDVVNEADEQPPAFQEVDP